MLADLNFYLPQTYPLYPIPVKDLLLHFRLGREKPPRLQLIPPPLVPSLRGVHSLYGLLGSQLIYVHLVGQISSPRAVQFAGVAPFVPSRRH